MVKQKKRTEQYLLRLTPEEKEQWQTMAKAAKLKTAALIRRRMAACQIHSIVPAVNWKTYWELEKALQKIKNSFQKMKEERNFDSTEVLDLINQEINSVKLQILGYQKGSVDLAKIEEDYDWESF